MAATHFPPHWTISVWDTPPLWYHCGPSLVPAHTPPSAGEVGWGGEGGVGRGHSTSHEGILSVYLLNRVAALASLQVAQCSSLFFMKLQVSLNE